MQSVDLVKRFSKAHLVVAIDVANSRQDTRTVSERNSGLAGDLRGRPREPPHGPGPARLPHRPAAGDELPRAHRGEHRLLRARMRIDLRRVGRAAPLRGVLRW